MWLLKVISEFYIILFLLILLLGSLKTIKVNKVYYYLAFAFAVCIGIMAFNLEPGVKLDLYRLQNYVKLLQFGDGSFFSKIWGVKGFMGGDSTQAMIGWNLICYAVKELGDVHWLSAIGSFLTFFNILYMIVDYAYSKGYTSELISIGILLAFMGAPVQYVLSGIRNILAVSYVLLAFYLLFYKKKSLVLSIIMLIFGITIHPAALFALFPVFFVKFRRQKLLRAIALFSLPIIFTLANAMKGLNIPLISLTVNRVLFYTNVQYQYDRPEMIANIAVFLTISFVYWYYKKQGYIKENNILQTYYINAYYLLGAMMVGCSIHRDFTLRIGYIMGIGAIPVLAAILWSKKDNLHDKYMNSFLILITIVCCIKVYYDTAIGILQWNFG